MGGPAVWTVRGADWGMRGARVYRGRPRRRPATGPAPRRDYDVEGTAVDADRPALRAAAADRHVTRRHRRARRAARGARATTSPTPSRSRSPTSAPASAARSGSGSPAAPRRAASSSCSAARTSRPSPPRAASRSRTRPPGSTCRPPGIDIETLEPLRRWRLAFAGEDASLDLELEACGAGLRAGRPTTPSRAPAACSASSSRCACAGRRDVGGQRLTIDGLGQRGRSWGSPDWSRIGRTRTVSAWFGDAALSVAAIAKAGEHDHGARGGERDDLRAGDDGLRARSAIRACRRPSTATAASGARRSSCGSPTTARRAARPATSLCGTTLDLGRLRLDTRVPHVADGRPRRRRPLRHPAPHRGLSRRAPRGAGSVVGAEPVPEVELEALAARAPTQRSRDEVRQDRLERLLLGDAGVERLLAAEAGGDLQRLAPVLAERREDADAGTRGWRSAGRPRARRARRRASTGRARRGRRRPWRSAPRAPARGSRRPTRARARRAAAGVPRGRRTRR